MFKFNNVKKIIIFFVIFTIPNLFASNRMFNVDDATEYSLTIPKREDSKLFWKKRKKYLGSYINTLRKLTGIIKYRYVSPSGKFSEILQNGDLINAVYNSLENKGFSYLCNENILKHCLKIFHISEWHRGGLSIRYFPEPEFRCNFYDIFIAFAEAKLNKNLYDYKIILGLEKLKTVLNETIIPNLRGEEINFWNSQIDGNGLAYNFVKNDKTSFLYNKLELLNILSIIKNLIGNNLQKLTLDNPNFEYLTRIKNELIINIQEKLEEIPENIQPEISTERISVCHNTYNNKTKVKVKNARTKRKHIKVNTRKRKSKAHNSAPNTSINTYAEPNFNSIPNMPTNDDTASNSMRTENTITLNMFPAYNPKNPTKKNRNREKPEYTRYSTSHQFTLDAMLFDLWKKQEEKK